MSLVQTVGYLAHCNTYPTSIAPTMKTNSNATKTLYLGLDIHKAETVIAILKSHRDAEPRYYGLHRHHLARSRRSYATFPVPEFHSLPRHKAISDTRIENHQT